MRRLLCRLALPLIPLALGVLLMGCGQKGPLYLPSDEAAAEQYGPRDADDAEGDSDSDSDSED